MRIKPLILSVCLSVLLLSSCSSNLPIVAYVLVVQPFDDIKQKKIQSQKEKNWIEEVQTKISARDADASGNCVLNLYSKPQSQYPDNSADIMFKKNQNACIDTVLTQWGEKPGNRQQLITVMAAYMIQVNEIEKDASPEAKEKATALRLKALTYMKNDYFTQSRVDLAPMYCCEDKRVEYKGQINVTGFVYDKNLIIDILNKLQQLEREADSCVYPHAIKNTISPKRFDQDELLRDGCNANLAQKDKRKWHIAWDNENIKNRIRIVNPDPCEDLKRLKPTGQGVLLLSLNADSKGFIYYDEPYTLTQDGCQIQKGLSNKKGEVLFDYSDQSLYIINAFFQDRLFTVPNEIRPLKK